MKSAGTFAKRRLDIERHRAIEEKATKRFGQSLVKRFFRHWKAFRAAKTISVDKSDGESVYDRLYSSVRDSFVLSCFSSL